MVDTWKVGAHFGKTGNLDDRFAENKTLISEAYLRQSIQEWNKKILWKTVFKNLKGCRLL